MKSFGTYISKHLVSFAVFLLILVVVNIVLFGATFYHTVSEDYGEASPRAMLEMTSTAATTEGLPDNAVQKLRQYNIWAMYLTPTGECFWTLDVPEEVPQNYDIQDVALFSKGYLEDYPVFIWNTDEGLLVLGYPKDSYMKLTSNYYSIEAIQKIPLYVIGMLGLDALCLFLAYYFSKRRIIQNIEPIVEAIETLADGKPASLHIDGELSEIAGSVNKASQIISRQNEARANWISGVSHDIRTPLSMIMGYAGRIAANEATTDKVREQAEIVRKQSVKIKELVQDLNLVSQLEYEMQPLHKDLACKSQDIDAIAFDSAPGKDHDIARVDVGLDHRVSLYLCCSEHLLADSLGHACQDIYASDFQAVLGQFLLPNSCRDFLRDEWDGKDAGL